MPEPENHTPDAGGPGGDLPPAFVERRVAQRRKKRVPRPFRHDRRSGFDRRASMPGGPVTQALIQLRDAPYALVALLLTINALNVLDLLLTFQLLGSGATEGNPVMRVLIGNDPLVAFFVKLGLVALATWGLWRVRRYKLVLFTCVLVFGGFVTLTTYEMVLLIVRL